MSSGGDAGSVADIGGAFSSGSSGVGSNGFAFTMPSGFDSGSGDSFAGLSGLQSGMSLPSQSAGANTYGFTSPTSGFSLTGAQSALGSASKALSTPTSSATAGGARAAGGGVRLQAQNFQSPIVDYVPATGSAGGSALLQLLQKLRPGNST